MQFSFVALFAALAGVAVATPMPLHLVRACDATTCAIALGPTGVGCLAAAVTAGVDPIADAGCVAGVLNSVVNAPSACAGCGSGVNSVVAGAESAVNSAVKDVSSAFGSIF